MAVNEARRLKGSSVSDDAMASSFDGRKASEAIEQEASRASLLNTTFIPAFCHCRKAGAAIIKQQADLADRGEHSGRKGTAQPPQDAFGSAGVPQGLIPGFVASPLKESSTPQR